MHAGRPNEALARYLAELRWSPRTLARRVNALYGPGTVSESAPYHWRDRGRVPYPPLPAHVARVLGDALGRYVDPAELWPGRATDTPAPVPAVGDAAAYWSPAGLSRLIEDWLRGGLLDRRPFVPLTGAALTGLVRAYPALEPATGAALTGLIRAYPALEPATGAALTGLVRAYPALEPARLAAALDGGAPGTALVTQIEATTVTLRALPAQVGSEPALAYVAAQFQAVALLLHQGGHPEHLRRRLFAALGELAMLAAWTAYDSGRHHLSQRYLLTGLRAAHEAGDGPLAARLLGDLSGHAGIAGRPDDAVALGEAAMRAAAGTTAGRAFIAGQLTYAYAVAGDADRVVRTGEQATELLHHLRPGTESPHLHHLALVTVGPMVGRSLVEVARLHLAGGHRRRARTLLRQGAERLSAHAYVGPEHPEQRKALYEGAHLAIAHAAGGELEQACEVGRTALARLPHVRSVRCHEVLRTLYRVLRRGRHRNPHVRDFLPQLGAGLRGS